MDKPGLLWELKKLRNKLANEEDIPPYLVFPNDSLEEMAEKKPFNEQSFRKIKGVGDIKVKKYSTIFISAIQKYSEEQNIPVQNSNNVGISIPDNALEQIYQLNLEIAGLNEKIKELTILKSGLLKKVVTVGVNHQGAYTLQSSSVHIRQLNLEAFKQLYPQVFMEIGSVKLNDVDRVLGKAEVTKFCTLKESTNYKVVKS